MGSQPGQATLGILLLALVLSIFDVIVGWPLSYVGNLILDAMMNVIPNFNLGTWESLAYQTILYGKIALFLIDLVGYITIFIILYAIYSRLSNNS